jgi:hypothetical protein
MTPMPKIAIAVARSRKGKTSNRMACAVLISAPPPMPWTTRQKTRPSSERAAPQKNEASVKRMIEPV